MGHMYSEEFTCTGAAERGGGIGGQVLVKHVGIVCRDSAVDRASHKT
jgi:hypothetical protein